jgi:plastocyanin domain-containing protein
MKGTATAIIIAGLMVGGSILLVKSSSSSGTPPTAENVSVEDGVQIVDLRAKGGYTPQRSIAKAGMPTILRVTTSSTFDCSAAIRIPSIGYSKLLGSTGTTDIDLGVRKSGILRGACGMGMYPFEIAFRD